MKHSWMSALCFGFLALTSVANSFAADTLPASLFLTESPEKAGDVTELKKTSKAGDEIVMRGQIGGQEKNVLNDTRASLMLADMKLVPCSKMPGDTCKTPWDFCCVPVNEKAAGIAIIQVPDAKGRPMKVSLKGANGLEPLSVIVVKGKVASNDNGNMVVNATGIYVEPKPAKASK